MRGEVTSTFKEHIQKIENHLEKQEERLYLLEQLSIKELEVLIVLLDRISKNKKSTLKMTINVGPVTEQN